MHLLCARTTKYLLDSWVNGNKSSRYLISEPDALKNLQELLDESGTWNVPKKFQQKKYELSDLTNWKATQTWFFLLYTSLLTKNFLPTSVYRDLMLLFVACRILCDHEGASLKAGWAKKYLRNFVRKLPKYYGEYSQSMNMHNLLHVADDVINLQIALSMFSSFHFEKYLGKLKKLFRTPHAPLA